MAPRPDTPLIDVQSISKYFGSVVALKDVSMAVRAGYDHFGAR